MNNSKPFALYAGSFDPFTIGHMDVVRKASKAFEVIICIAVNSKKKSKYNITSRLEAIKFACKREGILVGISVCTDELVADFCKRNNIEFMIRGIRDFMDFGYEDSIASCNKEINSSLETIYFRADNSFVSSSFVKELMDYNKPVTKYLPYPRAILEKGKL